MKTVGVWRNTISCALVGLLFLLVADIAASSQTAEHYPPTIVFMTDFGTLDDAVPICKGVMYSVMPSVRVVDLSHQVNPFSILDGARFLEGATPYYPEGTVFVVVVDPGVGSTRKAVIIKSKRGQYFVMPDNGLITMVADRDGLEGARQITNTTWMYGKALSSTFHGRDIFSPTGAHLARGDNWTEAGPEVDLKALVRLDLQPVKVDESGLRGAIIATDGPFGNLISNVSVEDFMKLGYQRGQTVPISIGDTRMELPFVNTFSDVAVNKPLIYIDSRGFFGLAVNQASFSAVYGIKPPAKFTIPRAK